MKRFVPPLCLLCALLIISGCGGTAANPGAGTPAVPESPDWPVLSIAPEDFGIEYDAESIGQLQEYPLDKLMAYYLGADGAYAEGASCELYRRFLDAPDTVLTAIALTGGETVRGTPARDLLCRAIACSAAWSETEAFNGILERYEKTPPAGRAADALVCLREQHAAGQNSN
jgi:hypothetical protein